MKYDLKTFCPFATVLKNYIMAVFGDYDARVYVVDSLWSVQGCNWGEEYHPVQNCKYGIFRTARRRCFRYRAAEKVRERERIGYTLIIRSLNLSIIPRLHLRSIIM